MARTDPRTWPLPVATGLVLLGFSANSLLGRAALVGGYADPATFAFVRMASGALALGLLMGADRASLREALHPGRGLSLAVYVLAFTFAYRSLTAGTGALLLFGAVQAALLILATLHGEALRGRRALGALLAFAGLLTFGLPTAARPPLGAALGMALAGGAWGVYTWLGRGTTHPVRDTGGAFGLAALLVLPFLAGPGLRICDGTGWALGLGSGILASGATYALWYTVVPRLGAARAAVVQMAVPPLTAGLGALGLREWPGPVWFLAAILTLGGITLATTSGSRSRARA